MEPMSERPAKKQCTTTSRTQAESRISIEHCSLKPSALSHKSILISPPVSPETSLDNCHQTVEKPQRNCQDLVLYPDDLATESADVNLFPAKLNKIRAPSSPTEICGSASKPLSRSEGVSNRRYKARTNILYNRDPLKFLEFVRREKASNSQNGLRASTEARRSDATKHGLRSVERQKIQRSQKSKKVENSDRSKETGEFGKSWKLQKPHQSLNHLTQQSSLASHGKQDKMKPVRAKSPAPCRAVLHSPTLPMDVKPTRKRVEDADFEALSDLCPPLSALINPKALRADWTGGGGSVDLSSDPNRARLDEKEIVLASTLRLSCATYLCSKRRIFIRLVESFRNNRDFRKTDAQQACKIDVNKASKLWSAFENSGWFRRELFEHFL